MTNAEAAKEFYNTELRTHLEENHYDEFVAIEPAMRRYFLGQTFLDAALAAKRELPEKKSFIIRVGHEAAFHLGGFGA